MSGRPAFEMLPQEEKRRKLQPWILYSAEFVRRYREAGAQALVTLIVVAGQGHNLDAGFFHSQALVDFAIASAGRCGRIPMMG